MGRRLSQNFLFDKKTLSEIVRASGVSAEDTVVEIGPGHGEMTELLSQSAARVVAVELDPRLYEMLAQRFKNTENVEPVHSDAMHYPYENLGPFRVVANIPYHITTPLIFRLLEHRESLLSMTLTVQKEVAERIAAGPGGKDYGVLSLTVQYHCTAELKFIVPRELFRPVPKVNSACLHIEVLKKPSVEVTDEDLFFRIIKTAFSQRRKTLHNSLKNLIPSIDSVLEESGIDPGLRPEKLGIREFALIAENSAKKQA